MVSYHEVRTNDGDAAALMEELSSCLERITGDSGKSSFANEDIDCSRSTFIVSKLNGKSVGCGAIRKVNDSTCEIKRMFARHRSSGIGHGILKALEEKAIEFGYERIILSTRRANSTAVSFYLRNGYKEIPNFGRYAGRNESICMEKKTKPNQAPEATNANGPVGSAWRL